MKSCELGKSGISVSKLGLGCMLFGSKINKDISYRILDNYVANGGNFLDTANNYAFWQDSCIGGESESLLGQWICERKNRANIVLATKVGALPNKTGPQDLTNIQGNSKKVIIEEVELCLKRLNTDFIDLLYLHIDDRNTDFNESLEALNLLKREGKIRSYGMSNIKTWRLEQARSVCKENNFDFFSAIQQKNSYLLPNRFYDSGVQEFVSDELVDYKNTYDDFSLVSYSIVLNGLLTKTSIDDFNFDSVYNRERLKEIQSNGIPWVYKAIAEQFEDSIALLSTSSENHLQEIMDIFTDDE